MEKSKTFYAWIEEQETALVLIHLFLALASMMYVSKSLAFVQFSLAVCFAVFFGSKTLHIYEGLVSRSKGELILNMGAAFFWIAVAGATLQTATQ